MLHEMTRDVGTLQEAEEAVGIVEDEAVEEAAAAEEAEKPPAEVVVPKGANTSFLLVKELAITAIEHSRVSSDLEFLASASQQHSKWVGRKSHATCLQQRCRHDSAGG